MKKTFLFLMMTLLLCIGSSAFNDVKAQTTESTVTIPANAESLAEAGNAQESGVAPINNNFQYSISQIYYTSGEINRKEDGVIKDISFKTKDNNENNYPYTREIEIYLVNTIDAAFSSKLMMQFSESDLYFNGNVEFSAEAWVTITLDKAFTYKGGNNVLICVNDKYYSDNAPDDGKDYVSPTAEFYAYTSGNTMRCLNHKNTSSTYDPTNTSITNLSSIGNTGNLPFIQFTFEEQSQGPITLVASPDDIATCDEVTFKVMQDDGTTTGKDVTTSAIIYQVDGTETIEHDGYTFTPSAAGEYTFYAKKGSVISEEITIEVKDEYVLNASTTNIIANDKDITTFSVTLCDEEVEGFTFYVNGEANGNTFSTAELGEYTVYGMKGTIKTNEITIYATEWKVTGWVTGNNFVNSIYGSNLNVVEIYDGNFRLWVLIDNNNKGIIINNNIDQYGSEPNLSYNPRSGHRPETPQPLSIPETINVGLFNNYYGIVTITKIANDVFCNVYDNTGISDFGNELNDNISSLTIPSTITEIGNKAFDFAYGEGFTITSKATEPPTIGNNTFGRKSDDNNTTNNYYSTLYVPSSSLEAYKAASYWSLFFEYGGNIEVDPESIIQYNGDGNWTETTKWSNKKLPTETDEVTINGNVKINTNVNVNVININENCSLTIQGEYTLRVNNIINNGNIVIEDGGQLYYNGSEELTVTVKKNIAGYGDDDVKDGWYTISSPVYSVEDMETYGGIPYYYTEIANVTNLIPSSYNYDLYRYYEYGDGEVGWWENYKQGESQLDYMLSDFTILSNGHGYLYASSKEVNLEFTGKVLTGSITHHCYKMNQNEDFNGFNLMGNPFTHDITLANVTGLEMASGFYTVTNAGTWETHASTDNIKPTQGMLIKITDTSIDVDGLGFITIAEETIAEESETRSRSNNSGSITIKVSNDRYTDNAIVSFSEGKGLNKFPHLNKEAHEVYVIDNETKYGVATMNDDVTTIPVGFEANTMGEYTISAEAIDCKFNSMTLTDKMTGVKTNLLTDSYTFMATTNDNPNRFTLTLNADNDTDNDFIYINNNEMIINNIEGNGLVQIYDVMGRSVATYNVSGSANISMETLSNGVYIVRMIDANGVKTQKVVNN